MERAIQEVQEETDEQGKAKEQVGTSQSTGGSSSDWENSGKEKDVSIMQSEQGPEEEEEEENVETPKPKKKAYSERHK